MKTFRKILMMFVVSLTSQIGFASDYFDDCGLTEGLKKIFEYSGYCITASKNKYKFSTTRYQLKDGTSCEIAYDAAPASATCVREVVLIDWTAP